MKTVLAALFIAAVCVSKTTALPSSRLAAERIASFNSQQRQKQHDSNDDQVLEQLIAEQSMEMKRDESSQMVWPTAALRQRTTNGNGARSGLVVRGPMGGGGAGVGVDAGPNGGGVGSGLNVGSVSAGQGAYGNRRGGGVQRGLRIGEFAGFNQGVSGGKQGDGYGGAGGTTFDILGLKGGNTGNVKPDKRGNTEVSQKKGIDGIYTEDNSVKAGKNGFKAKSKKCIAGDLFCTEGSLGNDGFGFNFSG